MLDRPGIKECDGLPPQPTPMSKTQMGQYLNDLRSSRVPRPNGSRPLPTTKRQPSVAITSDKDSAPKLSFTSSDTAPMPVHSRSYSRQSILQHHEPLSCKRNSLCDATHSGYMERTQRWTEKQEARSLRQALEKVDFEEEDRIKAAAQDEAAGLILTHQNGDGKYHVEKPPRKHGGHRANNSHKGRSEASVDVGRCSRNESTKSGVRSTSSSTVESGDKSNNDSTSDCPCPMEHETHLLENHENPDLPEEKSSTSRFRRPSITNLSKKRRNSSFRRTFSQEGNEGVFANPDDKIYEDPEERLEPQSTLKNSHETTHASYSRRNPFARAHATRQSLQTSSRPFVLSKGAEKKEECQPPSLAHPRAAKYASNLVSTSAEQQQETSDIKMRNGMEVRSEDIRAATSMKLKDRSPRLPSPTVVTDSPGRPIVSFKPDWKPDEVENTRDQYQHHQSTGPGLGKPAYAPNITPAAEIQRSHSTPAGVPTIVEPGKTSVMRNIPIIKPPDAPSIKVDTAPAVNVPSFNPPSITIEALPTIAVSDESSRMQPQKPASSRTPNLSNVRPGIHSAPASTSSLPHWSPAVRRQTALCAQCALPIAGRVVTAASTRFHPECFVCYHCNEGLECVAFYPEPEERRSSRLDRIQRRLNGEELEDQAGSTAADDGDDSLRFYCHLDFHEFFSPRCKSCKTPIEGEVIVACGAEWHVGHFFCAQCGDPFDPKTPFVEKDGYAWCVKCHTSRYSAKCKKCRKPVTDMVVKALGAEWHDQCFCCTECSGSFEDGRYFVRGQGQDPVCVRCEEKRLKA